MLGLCLFYCQWMSTCREFTACKDYLFAPVVELRGNSCHSPSSKPKRKYLTTTHVDTQNLFVLICFILLFLVLWRLLRFYTSLLPRNDDFLGRTNIECMYMVKSVIAVFLNMYRSHCLWSENWKLVCQYFCDISYFGIVVLILSFSVC